jgi:hypothetical protein
VEQNAHDHPAAEADSRKRGHPRPQQIVSVFNYHLHAVDHMVILIGFAFTADLRYPAVKDVVRVCANLKSDGLAHAHNPDERIRGAKIGS